MTTKTIISTAVSAILVLFISVQFCTAQNSDNSPENKNCYVMKDGKMFCMMDGRTTMPMEKDVTLTDGTKCMMNGDCMMKNGKIQKLKNGEYIDASGKVCKSDKMKKSESNSPKK